MRLPVLRASPAHGLGMPDWQVVIDSERLIENGSMEKLHENFVDRILITLATPQIFFANLISDLLGSWTEMATALTALLLALRVVDWSIRRFKFGWHKDDNTNHSEKDK